MSLNLTNLTNIFDMREYLLAHMRITKLESLLYLLLIVPLSVLGTLFNIISLIIFFKKSFQNVTLFKYLQVYTLNSLVITAAQIFFFFFSTYHLYDLSISYAAKIFKCYLAPSYLVGLCYFYGNVLDVLINIERALNFSDKYEKFKKISPYLLSAMLFLVCMLINVPNYFLFNMVSDEELTIKLKLCVSSSFSESSKGKIILLVCFIIEGPIVLVLVIMSSMVSMKSFRTYLNQKSRSLKLNNQILDKIKAKKQKRIDKLDRKLVVFTLCLSALTFVYHVVQFISQLVIYISDFNSKVQSVFVFLMSLACVLKHSSNIVLYCYFSSKFRSYITCHKIRNKEQDRKVGTL